MVKAGTRQDDSAVYLRAGWQRVGEVPAYALMPDGRSCATTFFFKHLAEVEEPTEHAM